VCSIHRMKVVDEILFLYRVTGMVVDCITDCRIKVYILLVVLRVTSWR